MNDSFIYLFDSKLHQCLERVNRYFEELVCLMQPRKIRRRLQFKGSKKIKALYETKLAEGKPYKVALIACVIKDIRPA